MTRPRPRPLSLRAALAAAALLSASGCSERVLTLDISLVTASCDAAPELSPLAGVTDLQIRVFGEGLNALDFQARANPADGLAQLPGIPVGRDRNIVVEALAVPGEKVVARGETGPLDLTAVTTDRLPVTVWLRRVSAFSSAARRETPGTCSELDQDRAAHAMALLSDGRVLVSGGFRFLGTGAATRLEYLRSTEIYDPRTGLFTAGPPMSVSRAYHSATRVPGTPYTVLAGGETLVSRDGVSAIDAVRLADIFDETTNEMLPPVQLGQARSRHVAAAGQLGGRVVLAGGYDAAGTPLATTELFDPDALSFRPGPTLPAPRADAALLAGPSGALYVIGGTDGTALVQRTDILVPAGADDYRLGATTTLNLTTGRASPLAALAGDRILVTGGFGRAFDRSQQPAFDAALASTELLRTVEGTASPTSATLSARRGYGGAVALLDGTVLVAGGGETDPQGATRLVTSADVLLTTTQGDLAVSPVNLPMRVARERARYQLLADGTVLVTGGITTGRVSLKSAEVFQPKYRSSPTGAHR